MAERDGLTRLTGLLMLLFINNTRPFTRSLEESKGHKRNRDISHHFILLHSLNSDCCCISAFFIQYIIIVFCIHTLWVRFLSLLHIHSLFIHSLPFTKTLDSVFQRWSNDKHGQYNVLPTHTIHLHTVCTTLLVHEAVGEEEHTQLRSWIIYRNYLDTDLAF